MQFLSMDDAPDYDPERCVATAYATGTHGNVRLIRLARGQVLPPHTHGESDLFLYVVEGVGMVTLAGGEDRQVVAGDLVQLTGDEELNVRSDYSDGVTLLAFLAPVFPPPSG